jgi:polysaccharide chain length determinant protein (PEP-CTERM system associated)
MAVEVDMNSQVEVMQRTLRSRPNLEEVLRMTGLDAQAHTPDERERLLRDLERDTAIRAEGVRNLFTVAYESRDPDLAKRVVQALLTIFVEGNLGRSRRDMEQALRFLDEQIKSYEDQLSAAERRLADFKRQNVGLLQESGSVASRIETAKQGLLQVKGQLDDARTRRTTLIAQLKQIPEFLELDSSPQFVIQGNGRTPTELEQRIAQAQKKLDELTLKYTDKHPDVIATREMLASLQAQQKAAVASEPAGSGTAGQQWSGKQRTSNAVYEQVRLKLVETESEIQMYERRFSEQESEIARLEQLASAAPAVEAELTSLNRDYDVLKKNYEELLARREAAKLSQDADSSADKVEFRVVEPPEVPLVPSSPNRSILVTLVLLVGGGAGVGFAFLLAQLNNAFTTIQQMRAAFPLPVLGGVSEVAMMPHRRWRASGVVGFAAGVFGLAIAYATIIAFVRYSIQPGDLLAPLWNGI